MSGKRREREEESEGVGLADFCFELRDRVIEKIATFFQLGSQLREGESRTLYYLLLIFKAICICVHFHFKLPDDGDII